MRSQESSIRFGRGVDLHVTFEDAVADIMSVKTYYRPLGVRTLTTYGYSEFEPGRSVEAALTISTASPSYYPPGVKFEVRFEVDDAAGNHLETDPWTIEYLDPRFRWQTVEKGDLTIVFHDRPVSTVQDLASQVAARMPRIEETVGAGGPAGPYRAILFNSGAELAPAFPTVSDTATAGHVFGGFAYEQYGLFVLENALLTGVTHELTHLIFGAATNSPTAKRPSWLNEGLAVYFETGSRSATRSRLAEAIRTGALLRIHSMNSIPGRPDDIAVFYPEAGNFAGFLVEEYGAAKMQALVASLRDGALPADAVATAYGLPIAALESQWRSDIGAPPLPSPAVTPAVPPTATARPTAGPIATGGSGTATAVPPSPTPLTAAATRPPRPRSFTIWYVAAGTALAGAGLVSLAAGLWRVSRRASRGPH